MKVTLLSFAHMHMGSYANHLHNHPDAEIVAIYNEDAALGADLASRYQTEFYPTLDEALAVESDAVVVCSANSDHKDMVIRSAKANKHIICEKPISTTVEDARAMIDACGEANVKLMTAFPCRFIPAVIRAKSIIDEGRMGKIIAVRGTNHGSMPGGWFIDKDKSGGGAVMDHTVHVADLIRWMLGVEFQDVYAEAGTMYHSDLGIDDTGLLTMSLSDGSFATLDTSWSRKPPFPTWGDVTMEIVGEKGVIEIDGFAQKVDVYSAVRGRSAWDYWGSDMDKYLVDNFVRMVIDDTEPFITGEDGLKAMELALAAYESARTGHVVRLPLNRPEVK